MIELKSKLYNRYTLASYVAGLGSIPLLFSGNSLVMGSSLLIGSFLGLLATENGNTTEDGYYRTLAHIERFGIIDPRFAQKMETSYCHNVGMRIAAKERGLEHLLE